MTKLAPLNDNIVEELFQHGWSVQPHYFDLDLISQLATEAKQCYDQDAMQPASIGRGTQNHYNHTVRQDVIHWLNYESAAQRAYQAQMAALQAHLNLNLMLGLFEYEAHFALYEAGGFYKKHIDSFQNQSSRVVSLVTYLNLEWPHTAGGELLLYAPEGEQLIQTVSPQAATLVAFLSEKMPHAVNPADRQRLSIAGWFRRRPLS